MNENLDFEQKSAKKLKGIIGVCGGSTISDEIYSMAESLGREIAERGYIVACGGLMGTMEAVCKGAKSKGGLTIGILPSYDKRIANKYVDIPICTGMGESRNIILVSTSDVIIVVAGGAGTLTEIGFAWKLDKPIVALTLSGGFAEQFSNKKIDTTRSDNIISAKDPTDAVKIAINLMETI